MTPEVDAWVIEHVMKPTVEGMKAEGNTYVGFLYAGLMIALTALPKVLEYNCRFGDPENTANYVALTI